MTANGVAHIKGLQGAAVDLWGTRVSGTVAACAKHYVGDGGVAFGTGQMAEKLLDRCDVRLSEAEFKEHLRPYVAAVKAGVMSIMVSFSSVHGKQMHAHRELIEGVLRQEMGFKGLVVSEYVCPSSFFSLSPLPIPHPWLCSLHVSLLGIERSR